MKPNMKELISRKVCDVSISLAERTVGLTPKSDLPISIIVLHQPDIPESLRKRMESNE